MLCVTRMCPPLSPGCLDRLTPSHWWSLSASHVFPQLNTSAHISTQRINSIVSHMQRPVVIQRCFTVKGHSWPADSVNTSPPHEQDETSVVRKHQHVRTMAVLSHVQTDKKNQNMVCAHIWLADPACCQMTLPCTGAKLEPGIHFLPDIPACWGQSEQSFNRLSHRLWNFGIAQRKVTISDGEFSYTSHFGALCPDFPSGFWNFDLKYAVIRESRRILRPQRMEADVYFFYWEEYKKNKFLKLCNITHRSHQGS